MKYLLRPFEENIHFGDPTGIKLYVQATKDMDKETDKLDVSVSNTKDIIEHFLRLSNKHVWVSHAFVVNNGTGEKNVFRVI